MCASMVLFEIRGQRPTVATLWTCVCSGGGGGGEGVSMRMLEEGGIWPLTVGLGISSEQQ